MSKGSLFPPAFSLLAFRRSVSLKLCPGSRSSLVNTAPVTMMPPLIMLRMIPTSQRNQCLRCDQDCAPFSFVRPYFSVLFFLSTSSFSLSVASSFSSHIYSLYLDIAFNLIVFITSGLFLSAFLSPRAFSLSPSPHLFLFFPSALCLSRCLSHHPLALSQPSPVFDLAFPLYLAVSLCVAVELSVSVCLSAPLISLLRPLTLSQCPPSTSFHLHIFTIHSDSSASPPVLNFVLSLIIFGCVRILHTHRCCQLPVTMSAAMRRLGVRAKSKASNRNLTLCYSHLFHFFCAGKRWQDCRWRTENKSDREEREARACVKMANYSRWKETRKQSTRKREGHPHPAERDRCLCGQTSWRRDADITHTSGVFGQEGQRHATGRARLPFVLFGQT